MTAATRKAIVALLAVDETATEAERNRVALALSGRYGVLSVAEAAERLGVSRPTIYRLIKAGYLTRTQGGEISELSIETYLCGNMGRVASCA